MHSSLKCFVFFRSQWRREDGRRHWCQRWCCASLVSRLSQRFSFLLPAVVISSCCDTAVAENLTFKAQGMSAAGAVAKSVSFPGSDQPQRQLQLRAICCSSFASNSVIDDALILLLNTCSMQWWCQRLSAVSSLLGRLLLRRRSTDCLLLRRERTEGARDDESLWGREREGERQGEAVTVYCFCLDSFTESGEGER